MQCEVKRLGLGDVGLLARIDRSERIEAEFTVRNGRLVERTVSMVDVPPWDPVGDGPYSVAAMVAFCEPILAGGAEFHGGFDGDELLGLAVVDPSFEPSLAWLALLHVTRSARRKGVASALWDVAVAAAMRAGATSMYVSATPTGSAVGFYLSRGCQLADPVHPQLYAMEPDDIHLTCLLGRPS